MQTALAPPAIGVPACTTEAVRTCTGVLIIRRGSTGDCALGGKITGLAAGVPATWGATDGVAKAGSVALSTSRFGV